MPAIPIDHWPERIERVIAQCALLRRVIVLNETNSTQDAARRMNARSGDVFIAWRQTAGRGRFGRAWADTGEDGVAVTIALDRREHDPPRLAIATAIGVAHVAESILNERVGVKWPNDIIVNSRKLAGILIENIDELALIGIGMNVRQTSWPDELAASAISLADCGVAIDRLEVLTELLPAVDAALGMNVEQLQREFAARDVLRGTRATFRQGERLTTGRVAALDPLRGLLVHSDEGEVWLDAATTTVVKPSP